MGTYVAPFPWFGGKSRVAGQVWKRFGDVPNYVEPFFGSGAVLLGRPGWISEVKWLETVNDKDGFIANFYRSVQQDPETVVQYAGGPVNENDLTARHIWLVSQKEELMLRLEGDPEFYDAKIAGWWVWGICCWIGGGWCAGKGPWGSENGRRVHLGDAGRGVKRQKVNLGNAGVGVNRQMVHLPDNRGVHKLSCQKAGGGDPGTGKAGLYAWMEALSERLYRVRVCSGDWSRVMGPSVTWAQHGCTGVFLDPPYSAEAGRDSGLYTEEDLSVAHEVRVWCLENGTNPLLRIALCGYQGEHDELEAVGWEAVEWKTQGGYGNQGNGRGRENAKREVIWFSPHCLHFGSRQIELGI